MVRGSVVFFIVVAMPCLAGARSPGQMPTPVEGRLSAAQLYPRDYSASWIDDGAFVYGPALLDFDLREFLSRTAPHLLPHEEVISHWSGYYSISPKVLLTLFELRSGIVTSGAVPPNLGEQIRDVLGALYGDFYAYRSATERDGRDDLNAATYALLNAFRSEALPADFAAHVESSRRKFLETYDRLFPASDRSQFAREPRATDVPPADLLQLPWKVGQSWYFNGVHTTTGNDPGVMSSIDFTRTWALDWGDDTSTDYVVAALAGQVTKYSSCQVRVTSPSGWTVNYYHLDNVIVTTGQQVTANQTLGTYASTESQALCQGGHSTGPHVHFSLLKNGVFAPLDGTELSQFLVHSGRYSYDSDPAYMWLEKAGIKYFAYSAAIPSATPVLPTISVSDVWLFEGDAGTKVARFTASLSATRPSSVTVNYATADGTASTANGDYAATSGTLVIPAGSTSLTFDVTVYGDSAVESSETFVVNFTNPSGATLGDGQGVAKILNDDFTNSSLSGVVVKTNHITELRSLINELRARRGLATYPFTSTLTPFITTVRAVDVVELRTALNAVYAAAGQSNPAYTNTITTGSLIRASDVTEIRNRAVSAP